MDYQSSYRPTVEFSDFKEQIYEKITKAKAVLTCAMFGMEFLRDDMQLDNQTLYYALWVVDDYLDEIVKA